MNKLILIAVGLCATIAAISAAPAAETCGVNQVFNECGSACPLQCPYRDARTGQITTGPDACIAVCVPGCFCAPGYVTDSKRTGSPCVRQADCTAP